MKIEENIKIIGDYFKDKVVKGEYEITKWSDTTVDIIIDGKYNFSLWIYLDCFSFYTILSTEKSIFHDTLKFTSDQKKEGRKNYNTKYEKYGKDSLTKTLKHKIAELQKELDNII